VRSGPGAARTILHTINDRPSKQTRMVGSTLGVLSFLGRFLFLQEQTKDIIIKVLCFFLFFFSKIPAKMTSMPSPVCVIENTL
jgi:hypothetical protein